MEAGMGREHLYRSAARENRNGQMSTLPNRNWHSGRDSRDDRAIPCHIRMPYILKKGSIYLYYLYSVEIMALTWENTVEMGGRDR
jgi:hypothetical protein